MNDQGSNQIKNQSKHQGAIHDNINIVQIYRS